MKRPPIEIEKRLYRVSHYRTIPQQERPILHVRWFGTETAAMKYAAESNKHQDSIGDAQVVAYKLDEVIA